MKQINSDKPERHFVVVSNAETVSIAKEKVVCWKMSGTDDGLAIQRPQSSAAGQADATLAGVPQANFAASGKNLLVQVFGITPHDVTIRVQTRANSTQSVQTTPTIAIGAPLVVDTVNNCFYPMASVAAVSAYKVQAFLAETVGDVSASIVGTDIASTGDNSAWYGSTASTVAAKVFLRCM